jgi:outer membrane protein assembly factor BamA
VIARFRWHSMLLVVLCLSASRLSASAAGWARPFAGSLGKIKDIRVTGLKRYTAAEVLPVSGLSVGQSVTEDDLKEATNLLARTGCFSNLAYSYSTIAGLLKVTLDLQESDKLLAVRFDNFVWWSDEDVKAKLKARVSLYRDELPMAGSLPDSVADALQAMLSERQLPGHVTYTRFGAEGHPLEAFIYHVEDISVRIRSVDFPGAGESEIPDLQNVVRKQLVGKQYSAAQVSLVADVDFRDVYQRRGYLQVSFGAPTTTAPDAAKPVVPGADPDDNPDANLVRVDVHVPVKAALQFHLSSVEWAGNHAIPTGELEKFVTLNPGDVADLPKLRDGLDAVSKMYGTKGYMNIRHTLVPHLDAAAKTAGFTVNIAEGDVYHFGELTIEGVDTKTAARLRERWALRPGEPFDASYEMTFMRQTQTLLPQGRWSSADTHLDESEKTVDVVLRYTAASIN